MKYKLKIRYIVLCTLLLVVWATQLIPAMGKIYAHSVYPVIAYILSSFSRLIPFAIGDLFIALSIAGVLLYPAYARRFQKKKWKRILLNDIEYLLWIYVWFYLAWGLNYSQPNFYQRTKIPYTAYTPENFRNFVDDYVDKLNGSYVDVTTINKDLIRRETVRGYNQISDTLGVHHPFHKSPRVKTMLFTPLISMVGVTGSMGPFFCEFTLNGDLLPSQYPATYAHELAHLLGISSEAEIELAGRISALTSALNKEIALLENALMEAKDAQNAQDEAVNYHQLVLPAMQALRCTADQLETLVEIGRAHV